RADSRADEIASLAEELRLGTTDPHASRVRMDALKWLAAKERPQIYGDRVTTQVTGDGRTLGEELAADPVNRDLELARRLAHLLTKGTMSMQEATVTPTAEPPPVILHLPMPPNPEPVAPMPPPPPQPTPAKQAEQERMNANRDMNEYLRVAN